jgi:hypothetical protein
MDHISEELKNLIEQNTDNSNILAKEIIVKYKDKLYEISYPHGENLLHWCGAYDNYVICEFLVNEMNFITNICNSRSVSPLYYASSGNSENVIKILLEFNADVRARSGFSNMFPHQVCNENLRNLFIEYEKNIPIDYDNGLEIKNGYTLVHAYNYRLCKFYAMILNSSFLTMNNKYNISQINEKCILDILNNNTFYQIKNMYVNVLEKYINGLNKAETNFCLNCNNYENIKRCSNCKKVYFCNTECQKVCHKFHNFDCKFKI